MCCTVRCVVYYAEGKGALGYCINQWEAHQSLSGAIGWVSANRLADRLPPQVPLLYSSALVLRSDSDSLWWTHTMLWRPTSGECGRATKSRQQTGSQGALRVLHSASCNRALLSKYKKSKFLLINEGKSCNLTYNQRKKITAWWVRYGTGLLVNVITELSVRSIGRRVDWTLIT